ncbi:histidinol-phosphate transaminase [Orrella daihaiensis]|uniref:Histidinol-phosphate aminotransferase n=1 Tax=Orrella daihaiensis TaxID=2782176 RepID=A0ABY4AMR8_9BURK|nr:histidinol-phosphate transaminase [Orrella daihaiensis]UOD51258.1 histidinol-phosphate transaminase [Orrella daihaiensis]
MSQFWSPSVRNLSPYVPGEQPQIDNLIKLNTNEHPMGPSPRVLEAIRAATTDRLRLYPDPEATQLKNAIAKRYGLTPEQVFVGNGSDDVLNLAFFTFFRQARPLLLSDLTYGFYPVYAELHGIRTHVVPVDDEFRIQPDDYLGQAHPKAGGIIIANPNAPTGIALDLSEIERIVAGNPDVVVLVDEAYVDFGGQSAVALLDRYPNLLVSHTLSKSRSLAGLRVGYALGSAELIQGLEIVKNSTNSYPLDQLAQVGATAAIEDDAYFEAACQAVIQTREWLTDQLQALGFEVLPSSANFVFARHPEHDGAALAGWLRERAILVRHFKRDRIDQFLRITVGTSAQCQSLINALKACVRP